MDQDESQIPANFVISRLQAHCPHYGFAGGIPTVKPFVGQPLEVISLGIVRLTGYVFVEYDRCVGVILLLQQRVPSAKPGRIEAGIKPQRFAVFRNGVGGRRLALLCQEVAQCEVCVSCPRAGAGMIGDELPQRLGGFGKLPASA